MKTHSCDVCGKAIDKDNPGVSVGEQQKSRVMVGDKNLAFYYEVRLVAFEVSHPDICQRCLFNALVNPAPEPAKPAA